MTPATTSLCLCIQCVKVRERGDVEYTQDYRDKTKLPDI